MPALTRDELAKTIMAIFELMQKKGMLPPMIGNKQQLVEKITDQISKVCDIQKEQLPDPKLQKTLCLAVSAEVVGEKYPEFKLNYDLFFKDHRDTPQAEIKNELKLQIGNTLTLLNTLSPKPIPSRSAKKFIDETAEGMADDLSKQYIQSNEATLAKNSNTVNIFDRMLSDVLCNLFGGTDPRYPGGQPRNVPVTLGNIQGYTNFSLPSANSFMGNEQNRDNEDLSRTDYGMKSTTIIDDIARGLEPMLEEEGLLKPSTPSPFSMTPLPHK